MGVVAAGAGRWRCIELGEHQTARGAGGGEGLVIGQGSVAAFGAVGVGRHWAESKSLSRLRFKNIEPRLLCSSAKRILRQRDVRLPPP